MPFYEGPLYSPGEKRKRPLEGGYLMPEEWGYGTRDYPGLGVVSPHRKWKDDRELCSMTIYSPGTAGREIYYREVKKVWISSHKLRQLKRHSLEGAILPVDRVKPTPSFTITPPLVEAVQKMVQVTLRNGDVMEGRLVSLGDTWQFRDEDYKFSVPASQIKRWCVTGG